MAYKEWDRYIQEFSLETCLARPPEGLYYSNKNADTVNNWSDISLHHIDRFKKDGVLIVNNAFELEDIHGAINAINDLLTGSSTTYKPEKWGGKFGVLLNKNENLDSLKIKGLRSLALARGLVEHDTRLRKISNNDNLINLLRAIMKNEPVLIHDMVRDKSKFHGDKPWHQDLTHFNIHYKSPVITAWIAFDNVPKESGCLYFIPGSHLDGPKKHVFCRDYQIPDTVVPRKGQIAAPLSSGGCVIFNSLVNHGSPPNKTRNRRLALQLTFKEMGAPIITNEERIMTFSK